MTKTLRSYNVSIFRITLKNLESKGRPSNLKSELGAAPVPALCIIPENTNKKRKTRMAGCEYAKSRNIILKIVGSFWKMT